MLSFSESQPYFHLFSAGCKTDNLFHSDEEFRSGMNAVALAVLGTGIEIVAFAIMSNHFHFVVHASEEQVFTFRCRLTQKYMRRRQYFETNIGIPPFKWGMKKVEDIPHLQVAIAYTLRNPAFLCPSVLSDYPWSSYSLYWRDKAYFRSVESLSVRVSDLTTRQLRNIIHSCDVLPENWLISREGVIWPGNYINYKEVNKIFESADAFNHRMSYVRREERQDLMEGHKHFGITDQEVITYARKYCKELFGHEKYTKMHVRNRKDLADKLYRELGCPDKQLARILHVEITY